MKPFPCNHPLDLSNKFALDASNLVHSPIDDATFSYEVHEPFLERLSTYTLTFETVNHIDSDRVCYVKYTFPSELDISELDYSSIEGQGMLVD